MTSESLACPKCGVSVPRSALETHLYQDFRYIPYQCGLCWIRFATLASASAHFSARATRHPGRLPDIIEALDDDVEGAIQRFLAAATHQNASVKEVGTTVQNHTLRLLATVKDEATVERIIPTEDDTPKAVVPESHMSTEEANEEMLVSSPDAKIVEAQPTKSESQSRSIIRPSEMAAGDHLSLSSMEVNVDAMCNPCNRPVTAGQMEAHVNHFHPNITHFSCNFCDFKNSSSGDGQIRRHIQAFHRITNPTRSDFSAQASSNTQLEAGVKEECIAFPESIADSPNTHPSDSHKISNDNSNCQRTKCRACGQMISSVTQNVKNHIGVKHLDDFLITCRLCSYGSRNWKGGIRDVIRHIKKVHKLSDNTGIQTSFNDQRSSELNQTVNNLMAKLFGAESSNFVRKVKMNLTEHRDPVESGPGPAEATALAPRALKGPSEVIPSEAPVNCRLCSKYVIATRHCLWSHICHDHLSAAVWECRLCDYVSRMWYGKGCGASRHARAHHAGSVFEDVMRNRREELEPELRGFLLQCFGPQPKLTPRAAERAPTLDEEEAEDAPPPDHGCKLCGVDVAVEARRAHAMSVHGKVGPSLACHFCDYVEEQSVDLEGITAHLKGAHRVDVPGVRGHFADRRAEIAGVVTNTFKACFPS